MRAANLLLLFFLCRISVSFCQQPDSIDSLERRARLEKTPEIRISLIMKLAGRYINGNAPKALVLAKEAYQLAEFSGSGEEKVHTSLLVAKVYFFMSDMKNGMEYAIRARTLAEAGGMQLELAQSLDALGLIFYDIGNQNKSIENFFASLKIYEKLNDKVGLGATFCRIGSLYYDQKDFVKAADYYSKSIDLARELGHTDGIASNLHNLAKVYYQQHEYEKSLTTFQEALKINLESGNNYLAGNNYLNIADVYIDQHNMAEAIEQVSKARNIFLTLGNKLRLAKSMMILGKIYYQTTNYIKSDSLEKASLAIGIENGYKDIIVGSAEILHNSYLARKDSIAAFRYFIVERQYKDSLFLEEKQKTLNRFELQEQVEKNEYNLKMARQRRNIVILIVSGCLVFSIIIIILILKQLRLRARQMELEKAGYEKELEFKNKELIISVMSLMKKNEMLTDLSEKLVKIEKESTTEEGKNTVQKVAHELQKSQDDEIWKEFSIRFKEIHGDFYNRLLQKFPTLTPNELKLCAFLRLNMSSKDIAELTGQRVSTLETARYRLRQKLGIVNSETNLIAFLSSF